MSNRNFLYLAIFVCLLAGLLGAVSAYRDMREREELDRELQDWQHRQWVQELLEQRREEFRLIGRHKL